MDVARDARWGRVTETYGEDPFLVSAMSVAFTRGMQGNDLREGVLVCAKHFLGYGVTEAGQNMAASAIGPRELYDVYARPFEAAIRLAGLAGVMASYSEYEGVPIHVSRAVLTDLLRGRMGFTGTVVSDYNGVGWAQTRQPASLPLAIVGEPARAESQTAWTGLAFDAARRFPTTLLGTPRPRLRSSRLETVSRRHPVDQVLDVGRAPAGPGPGS